MDKFVKISHVVEGGQQVLFRVNEDDEVTQMLEFFDGEWQGVAGIASGMPISNDIVALIAKRKYEKDLTSKVTYFDRGPNGTVTTRTELKPMDEEYRPRFKADLTVIVHNKDGGEERIRYERIEPPDCDAIKLFGRTTIAEGYWMEDDNGELDDEPKKSTPQH